jgi:hypothetical protein
LIFLQARYDTHAKATSRIILNPVKTQFNIRIIITIPCVFNLFELYVKCEMIIPLGRNQVSLFLSGCWISWSWSLNKFNRLIFHALIVRR